MWQMAGPLIKQPPSPMKPEEIRDIIANERANAQQGKVANSVILHFKKKVNGKKALYLVPKELQRCRIYSGRLFYRECLDDVWTEETSVPLDYIQHASVICP